MVLWPMKFRRIWAGAILLASLGNRSACAHAEPDGTLDYGSAMVPDMHARPLNRTSPRTVHLLGDSLTQKSACVRAQLVRDLGSCKLSDAAPYLRTALSDADPMVRAQAAQSIGTIGDSALAPMLR